MRKVRIRTVMPRGRSTLAISNLHVAYGQTEVLHGLNF